MNDPRGQRITPLVLALRTRSLRFWIATCLVVTLLPLAISAVGGYVLLHSGVIAPFDDVASRQREQVIPAQHLRILILDTLSPIDEYVQEGDPVHPATYRLLRTRIESDFASVIEAVAFEPQTQDLVMRARDNWTAADRFATEIISAPGKSGRPETTETMHRFHGEVAATSDKLAAFYEHLAEAIEADHDTAILAYERSQWMAGIACGISLLSIIFGVALIGRILTGSVDRLVDGAVRFAEGDRDHRIKVQVPPELHRVAEEFNHMIVRIRESESALADLAQRDSLTGLPNRRAYDDVFADVLARHQRFSEPAALLAIDIDHFKQVNDTYGHAAGDEVLRTVSRVMSRSVRPFDTVFRVGGEEFNVLLTKSTPDQALETAERLRQAIAETPVKIGDRTITVTVSAGLVAFSRGQDQITLSEAADSALYQAKASGRNRVMVSDAIKVMRAS